MRVRAPALTRDAVVVDVVEVKPEEVKEEKIEGAAERLIAEKRKAASQGAEVLKAFFHPYHQATIERQLIKTGLDLPTYRQLAEEVIADWTERGETHNDWQGTFDIKAATLHLQNAIRIKTREHRREQAAPKSRQQARQDLMAASYAGLQRVINGDLPAQPEDPAPF